MVEDSVGGHRNLRNGFGSESKSSHFEMMGRDNLRSSRGGNWRDWSSNWVAAGAVLGKRPSEIVKR